MQCKSARCDRPADVRPRASARSCNARSIRSRRRPHGAWRPAPLRARPGWPRGCAAAISPAPAAAPSPLAPAGRSGARWHRGQGGSCTNAIATAGRRSHRSAGARRPAPACGRRRWPAMPWARPRSTARITAARLARQPRHQLRRRAHAIASLLLPSTSRYAVSEARRVRLAVSGCVPEKSSNVNTERPKGPHVSASRARTGRPIPRRWDPAVHSSQPSPIVAFG